MITRSTAGAILALAFYGVSVVTTLLRYVFTPSIAERATGSAFAAMFVFAALFAAGGAVAAHVSGSRWRVVRYLGVGAIVGSLVWSYLTATWTLTARASSIYPPEYSAMTGALIGAGAGLLGGVLLLLITSARRLFAARTT